jgi:hypothetical protein
MKASLRRFLGAKLAYLFELSHDFLWFRRAGPANLIARLREQCFSYHGSFFEPGLFLLRRAREEPVRPCPVYQVDYEGIGMFHTPIVTSHGINFKVPVLLISVDRSYVARGRAA